MSMNGYPHRTLRQLTTLISSGSTPLGGQSVYLGDGPVMLVRSQNVQMNRLDVSDVAYISNEVDSQMQRSVVRHNDVLLNITGASIGRVARFELENTRANVNQHVCIIRPKPDQLSSRYLEYFLSSPQVQNDINNRHQRGGTRQALTFAQISEFQIPLPPLSEQKRIADILDKANAIRRKRQEAIDLAGTFQQGLFCEMFGDPISNEMRWPVKSFAELASNQDGRRKPVKASDREKVSGEYPYYGASGIIDYVDSYLFDETALLIGEDGANLLARSTPIAFLATRRYWVNNHAHVVTANGNATLLYLATHLNMRNIRDFVTGSAQPKLNQANLNKIPIPCPPITLQEEFDRRVNAFDLIRKKQENADKEAEATFNSLVQRAFNGGL
jgi:type I restriction enzyme S subunit